MKKICWITPDCFLDTDLNIEQMNGILKEYSIHWIILLNTRGARYKESDFTPLLSNSNLTIDFFYQHHRARDPRNLFSYHKLYRLIKKQHSDLIYFNVVPSSPYILPVYLSFPKKKTIFTAHDGSVKPSFRMASISKKVFEKAYRSIWYVNMFSTSQAELFLGNYSPRKLFIIPLGLKRFGKSNTNKRTDCISFFFFGSIHSDKNLGLLIEAACQLWEEGVRGFKVSINGAPHGDWNIYEQKIKYPELFENTIRPLDNSEIPDLFAYNHYMVFPYKEMSQSGALKVAFNYNVPVIVSDLKGFTNEVQENINGYIFENQNIDSLKKIMKQCIQNHQIEYPRLCRRMREYISNKYSQEAITEKYILMFNEIISIND